MDKNLKSLKICVEKMSPILKNIKKIKNLNDKKLKSTLGSIRAAFLKTKIWPPNKTTLNIFFMNPGASKDISRTRYSLNYLTDENGAKVEVDPLQGIIDSQNMSVVDAIKLIINERYNKFSGMTFNFVTNIKDSDIRISFDSGDGAWSYIGTDCASPEYKNQPTMNLGWFDVATVIHEFGHAIGLIHEHQNPLGKDIEWNTKVLYRWASQTQGWDDQTTYTNIVEKYSIEQLNGSSFDPYSIMLYFFPAQVTLDGKGTRQNLQLSEVDVQYISKIYPNGKMSPQEFYQFAYKKNIGEPIKVSENDSPSSSPPVTLNLQLIIPISIAAVILLFAIIFFAMRR